MINLTFCYLLFIASVQSTFLDATRFGYNIKTKVGGINTPTYGDNACDEFIDCYNCTVNSCLWSSGAAGTKGSCEIPSEDLDQIDREVHAKDNAGHTYLGLQIETFFANAGKCTDYLGLCRRAEDFRTIEIGQNVL
jgi:hypothetical protein